MIIKVNNHFITYKKYSIHESDKILINVCERKIFELEVFFGEPFEIKLFLYDSEFMYMLHYYYDGKISFHNEYYGMYLAEEMELNINIQPFFNNVWNYLWLV